MYFGLAAALAAWYNLPFIGRTTYHQKARHIIRRVGRLVSNHSLSALLFYPKINEHDFI